MPRRSGIHHLHLALCDLAADALIERPGKRLIALIFDPIDGIALIDGGQLGDNAVHPCVGCLWIHRAGEVNLQMSATRSPRSVERSNASVREASHVLFIVAIVFWLPI